MVSEVVKMGEIKVSKGQCSIVCYGLGSCVGLFLHDPISKIGGGAHIMFPDTGDEDAATNTSYYAREALKMLIEQMLIQGGIKLFLQAKLVGGANVLLPGLSGVGSKIIEIIQAELKKYNIPVTGNDLGGNSYRTARFFTDNGRLEIRSLAGQHVL